MKKLIPFILVCILLQPFVAAQDASSVIRLNQIGFYPDAPKIAVVSGNVTEDILIKSLPSGRVVYKAKPGKLLNSPFSPKKSHIVDFSEVTKPGRYVLNLPGEGDSYTFEISKGVFNSLTSALIKAFYYQRMSMPLLTEYAGKWSRQVGHPDKKVIIHPAAASSTRPAGTIISCPGGWYDAGDYNKYVVNSGITMGTLLSLYEDFPTLFDTLKTNIPESGNGAPDLLNELLWNLRWMLTMQDPADGGVYNKVTNAGFDGFVMPDAAKSPRYVVPKGTAATLDFAAVAAQSARIFDKYRKVFPGLSDSCMNAAEKAWKWASKNPDVSYDQNLMNKEFKPAITTGGYGDSDFRDEFIWAASELYISTGKESYYSSNPVFPDTLMPLPSWDNVRLLGYYTLARFENKLTGQAKTDFALIRKRIINEGDVLMKGINELPYQTAIGKSAGDFVWGSNSVAANQGVLLLQAYKLSKDRKFLNCALASLDYILGRNATGYSFVTGYGHKTPMHPHHRLSEADGIADPIPGFMVGGPNPGQQDGCKSYPSAIPDESYTDTVCSYASNEIAINWNAPAAYLAGALEALY